MYEDEIIKEVRKAREEHASKFDFDIEKIFLDLKEQEKKYSNRIVSLKPKRLKSTISGKSTNQI